MWFNRSVQPGTVAFISRKLKQPTFPSNIERLGVVTFLAMASRSPEPSLDLQSRELARHILMHATRYCDFGAFDAFFADKWSRRKLNHIVLNFRYSLTLFDDGPFDEDYMGQGE
jgi:hypothetical protein